MATDHKNKITRVRRYSWLNIGTLLFGAIFLYMIITVIVYLTAKHITSYEVTAGSISGNYRYTALALKTEECIPADYSGYVTYYARNGAKCGAGMTVCSINEYEQKSSMLTDLHLSDEDYEALGSSMASFALYFSDSAFQDVYNLKADLESYLISSADSVNTSGVLLNQVTAPSSGFVSYTIDGMETLTEADLNKSLFNRTGYHTDNLRLNTSVRMGDTLYKLIKGEEWNLYFPISSSLATELEDRSTIRFRFLKDDTTFQAAFSILMSDGEYYGKIALRNSLVRYVNDRYLEIELLMDSKKGLKIPASSIAEKIFCRVPEEYAIENVNSSNEITLLRERFRTSRGRIPRRRNRRSWNSRRRLFRRKRTGLPERRIRNPGNGAKSLQGCSAKRWKKVRITTGAREFPSASVTVDMAEFETSGMISPLSF